MQENKNEELAKIADLLLDVGSTLMGAGANTGRIRVTVNRIAHSLGYQIELLITHRALMLSVIDDDGGFYTSKLKRTPPHGVNYKLVSGISKMSWKVQDEDWDISHIISDLARLKALPHYDRWQVLVLVSLAGAAFCRLFGGEWLDMSVAFVATFAGLFLRQEAVKQNFNTYLCVFSGATVAAMVSGLAVFNHWGPHPEHAFATSVLFLVPGVPLINSFTDVIDGNISIGIARGMHGFMIAFAITLGLLIAMIAYNI